MTSDADPKNLARAQRKRKTKDPCPECFLHKELCICSFFPHLHLKTKLSLVIHAKELKRTTNTGRLAVKCLVNSEMLVRGLPDSVLDLTKSISPDYENVLFYPSEDAIELTDAWVRKQSKPIHLIVPDGNWRQASKVHIRHKELSHLPRIKFSEVNSDLNFIRAESKAEGMATLQAIAKALGVIEGPAVEQQLMQLYERKLTQTLKSRGVFVD